VPTEMVTKGESRAFAAPAAAAVPAGERRFRAALRRLRSERTLRRWIVAWLGASVLGIVNGGIRDFAYEERVGESTAGQISTGTLIALVTLYFLGLAAALASREQARGTSGSSSSSGSPPARWLFGQSPPSPDLAGRARNRSPVRLPGPTREERQLGRRQPLSVPSKYLSLTTYRRDVTPRLNTGLVRRRGRASVPPQSLRPVRVGPGRDGHSHLRSLQGAPAQRPALCSRQGVSARAVSGVGGGCAMLRSSPPRPATAVRARARPGRTATTRTRLYST
jgi:hypothetical protein